LPITHTGILFRLTSPAGTSPEACSRYSQLRHVDTPQIPEELLTALATVVWIGPGERPKVLLLIYEGDLAIYALA